MKNKGEINQEQKSIGVYADENSVIHADGASITGYDQGLVASNNSVISAKKAVVSRMSDAEIEELKAKLMVDIEEIITEAKEGNSHRATLLVNFLSQVGSGVLVGYLKSKGYID